MNSILFTPLPCTLQLHGIDLTCSRASGLFPEPKEMVDFSIISLFFFSARFSFFSFNYYPSHKNRHRKKRAAATDKRLQPEIPRTCSPFSSRLKYSGNSLSSFFVLCFFSCVANKKTHEMIFPRFRLRSDENVCFSQLRRQNGISAQRDGN